MSPWLYLGVPALLFGLFWALLPALTAPRARPAREPLRWPRCPECGAHLSCVKRPLGTEDIGSYEFRCQGLLPETWQGHHSEFIWDGKKWM